jgi:hypothetical protein
MNHANNSPIPLMGLHIPKCAGSTLSARVRKSLSSSSYFQSSSHLQNFANGELGFLQKWNRGRLRFIYGHSTHEEMLRFLPTPPVLFTGLRDPHERMISFINYEIRQGVIRGDPPVEVAVIASWAKNQMCDLIIKSFPTLAGTQGSLPDRAMRALENFSLVYFADNFELAASAICTHLDIKPAKADHNVSQEKLAFEYDENLIAEDMRLYSRARSMFWRDSFDELVPTESIVKFYSFPPDTERLRLFLANQTFRELNSWGKMTEFIRTQNALIKETQALVDLAENWAP